MASIAWANLSNLQSKSYTCGHCANPIAAQTGFTGKESNITSAFIYICHFCKMPTFFYEDIQVPGTQFGHPVNHIPDANVEKLYEEARSCFSYNAFTSSVMCCRKLLMNIAVSEGAKEGEFFINYVDYLEQNNFIPPKGKAWVDTIRKIGNEANHSIEFRSQEEARLILTFVEMLLKFIYEMPGMLGNP